MSEAADRPGAVVARLRALVEEEGGPLAAALRADPRGDDAFGPLAAAGDRPRAAAAEYALLVEAIFEGYLLHYAEGRLVAPADPDLRLLGGDYLYALGLHRLAALGDLAAVAELADLISLCAHVHAEPEASVGRLPVGPLWALAALAVGGGRWREQRRSKTLVRARRVDAHDVALACAERRARELGVERELANALIAFDRAVFDRPTTT